MKQILVGVIALSMTLLCSCGKAGKLVETTTQIPAELTKEVAVESKPWLTETDWKYLRYASIGVGLALVFAAGAIYGSYLGSKAGYERGQDKQHELDMPAFKSNREIGQKEGKKEGYQQATNEANAQIQTLTADHASALSQAQQWAQQQYVVGEQNGLDRGRQEGRDAGFQDGVAAVLAAMPSLAATPNFQPASSFPVEPQLNQPPTFIPNANHSPYAGQAPANIPSIPNSPLVPVQSNIPSVPVQSRSASQHIAPQEAQSPQVNFQTQFSVQDQNIPRVSFRRSSVIGPDSNMPLFGDIFSEHNLLPQLISTPNTSYSHYGLNANNQGQWTQAQLVELFEGIIRNGHSQADQAAQALQALRQGQAQAPQVPQAVGGFPAQQGVDQRQFLAQAQARLDAQNQASTQNNAPQQRAENEAFRQQFLNPDIH